MRESRQPSNHTPPAINLGVSLCVSNRYFCFWGGGSLVARYYLLLSQVKGGFSTTSILGNVQQRSPWRSGPKLTQRSGSWHLPMLCRVPSSIQPISAMTTSQRVAALWLAMSGGSMLVPRQGHQWGSTQQESGQFACAGTQCVSATCRFQHICLGCHQIHKSQHCPLRRRI